MTDDTQEVHMTPSVPWVLIIQKSHQYKTKALTFLTEFAVSTQDDVQVLRQW